MSDFAAVRDAAVRLADELSGPAAATFTRAFLATAAPEDVVSFPPETLARLAGLARDLAAARPTGETLVRVFAPETAADGFTYGGAILIAVNDDKPFLYDSILGELGAQGFTVAAAFHPIVERSTGQGRESVIVIAIARERDPARLMAVEEGARRVFADVCAAVGDWRQMLEKLNESIDELKRNQPPIEPAELNETVAFLKWLADNHFTLLGCRDYTFDAASRKHSAIDATGLGVLRNADIRIIRRPEDAAELTPEVMGFLTDPDPLIITKANSRSRVHRAAAQDYIGVKRFDASGRLIGERRFVGLFTSSAYHQLPAEIPLLRRKAARVVERAGFDPRSHDGKALAHVIEVFPRDDLFQISEDELLNQALGIMHVLERPRVKTFLRVDRFDRFVSALTYMPRDRYAGAVRLKIGEILSHAFGGEVTLSNPTFDETPVARVHTIVTRGTGAAIDSAKLEAEIEAATVTWPDRLADALGASDLTDGPVLATRYADAFPVSYRDQIKPEDALADIARLEALNAGGLADGAASFHAYREPGDATSSLRLKLLRAGGPAELSSVLPILENMGLTVAEETNYRVAPRGFARPVTIHAFSMRLKRPQPLDLAKVGTKFEEAVAAAWTGASEDDGFNALTLTAGLGKHSVTILRAVAKFLRQAGIAFSQPYMEEALVRNPDIAAFIVELFEARFAPGWAGDKELGVKTVDSLRERIENALRDVKSLDEDRILRRFRNAVDAMLRTNAWQRGPDGADRPALSFKFDSAKLDELPAPRPWVEIFVYSPRVEGVHLRYGRVARGGIRWSDRREDFRTEILGLVKAQQVKNAVIVPVGSKGGFYPKMLPKDASREAVNAEGVAAYTIFIDAMLDLTDTIAADGSIVPPEGVQRLDGDDPYLVVAADKGTATFSDTANGIAMRRHFWLDDAFASGGSAGYDHKKMGITARGAWEAVKRHFREMGRDSQTEPFTVAGVGDMSGDVFGNGMLLSKAIRLVAAFDHRDIFIDPDPDTLASFAERERLFNLPRSSWADYNRELISKGGGIFSRSLKSIALTPEIKTLTGLTADAVTPFELMNAILKAEVDLLWFGGIGTYIKGTPQSHPQAGDRANDAIRIDGREVRAKVIGEGANLGVTQLGRIEAARAGVRINTDAIDNSAGVDTSDHEVNLKILFAAAAGHGALTREERDAILVSMTDDVAAHVLQDNYRQTLALSIAESDALGELEGQARLMRALEAKGKLDRAVEVLPDETAIRALRGAGQGLTRPETAVLLAYAKIDLNQALLDSGLPDDPAFADDLAGYFPPQVRERFAADIAQHRLKRELVATILCNDIVNRAGPSFVQGVAEASGAGLAAVARAAAMASGAFRLADLYDRINALDGKVTATVQTAMHKDAIELLKRETLWMLRNVSAEAAIDQTVARYRDGIDTLKGTFSGLVSPLERDAVTARIAELTNAGVPADLADETGALPLFATVADMVALAHETTIPLDAVAGAYFAAGAALGIDRLREQARRVKPNGHWDALSLTRIEDDLFAIQRLVAAKALKDVTPAPELQREQGATAVGAWAESAAGGIERARALVAELERDGAFTAAKLALATAQLRDLAM
ncbi:NAD-specific glutamate dehydrogenase [Alphaproteobacteria bacterium SO-S41]|nr:NAD-specific glutamate dehydrogenase [Alphaproteobacteria bacterium SO-S41]